MDKVYSSIKKFFLPFSLLGISIIFLVLRLGWERTIEFGYDQPILASNVLDFLKHPSFINSYRFVNVNPWGYPSWGPVQIFFWAPFLAISPHPILASQLVAIFNSLSVVLVILIGWKYFSSWVGIAAGLLLAVQPWWVIFSRMVYEPTPVPTFVAFLMLLTFYLLEKPRSWALAVFILVSGILFQFYVHTISIIIPSYLFVIKHLKSLKIKSALLGFFLTLILFLPVIFFYSKNQSLIFDFIKVQKKFETMTPDRMSLFKDTVYQFVSVSAGNGLEWQLGYAYENFFDKLPILNSLSKTIFIFVIVVILFNFGKLFFPDPIRTRRMLLLFWLIGPVWFLTLIKSPFALPRYFLISLPALSLLMGLFFVEVGSAKVFPKITKSIAVILVGGLATLWIVLTISYYNFISNYTYPKGFLSYYSDIPYVFYDGALGWIINDSFTKGYDSITISDNLKKPKTNSLSVATYYVWKNIYGSFGRGIQKGNTGNYILHLTPITEEDELWKPRQFGPLIVFDYGSFNN